MSNVELRPWYDTKFFYEIFEDVNDFVYTYQNIGIPKTISVTSAATLYYLLYARYGNNPIANYDQNQFKYKIFSIVFQYGPTWEKRLDVQTKLRALTDDQIKEGSKAVFDHAYNPTELDTSGDIPYINEQNKSRYTKSPLEGYAVLIELLKTDVTGEFLSKFQSCFKQFVRPERTWIYVTDIDEEEDGE